MKYALPLAVCLLAAVPVAAQDGLTFGTPGGELEVPNRFVKFEALGIGLGIMTGNYGNSLLPIRLAKVTYMSGRLRFGAAFGDLYWNPHRGILGDVVALAAPVHVGFTLWNNPVGSRVFYGSNPDIYVEATCSPWGALLGSEPAAKVVLSADVDDYGFGLRVETGGVCGITSRQYGLYVMLQVRLLTFGVGF